MFHATERLPHLLPPTSYGSAEQFLWEMNNVFSHSWHFVAVKSDLSKPGDFVTVEICGKPIQVRNIGGQLHAVSNVCAHRHCVLTSLRKGNSPKLRCQYHGWEYDASGASARIPQAQYFAPLDRDSARIAAYRVESVGQLVFVNLDSAANSLETSLGASFVEVQRGFGDGWEQMLFREVTQRVNWKIPIENSLEAYHVPAVHPETFKSDPGEDRSKHVLDEFGSSFETTLPFAPHSKVDAWFQSIESRVLRFLIGAQPTSQYQQHHVFPNILFSFTDMISLLHVIHPTAPEICTSTIYQFGRVGQSPLSSQFCRLWGYSAAAITMKVMREDFELYPAIQRGLNASQTPGMLGRCEERIYHFQKWMKNQPTCPDSPKSSTEGTGPETKLEFDHSCSSCLTDTLNN